MFGLYDFTTCAQTMNTDIRYNKQIPVFIIKMNRICKIFVKSQKPKGRFHIPAEKSVCLYLS